MLIVIRTVTTKNILSDRAKHMCVSKLSGIRKNHQKPLVVVIVLGALTVLMKFPSPTN